VAAQGPTRAGLRLLWGRRRPFDEDDCVFRVARARIRAAFAYGAVLGFGLSTVIYSPLVHVSLAASILLLDPDSQWLGVVFAIVRVGGPLLFAGVGGAADLEGVGRVLTRLARWYAPMRAMQVAALAGLVAWFALH